MVVRVCRVLVAPFRPDNATGLMFPWPTALFPVLLRCFHLRFRTRPATNASPRTSEVLSIKAQGDVLIAMGTRKGFGHLGIILNKIRIVKKKITLPFDPLHSRLQ